MFRSKKIFFLVTALIVLLAVFLAIKLDKDGRADKSISPARQKIKLPVIINNEGLTATGVELTNRFEDLTLGYSINYRGDWFYEKPDGQTVIFSGKKETDAYYSTLQIRNISSKNYGKGDNAAVILVDDLKNQFLNSDESGVVSETQNFDFTVEKGEKIKGYMFVAEYIFKNIAYRQWQLVIPRADGQLFYNISYTSSKDDYERYLPIIKAMIGSLEIK